MNISNEQMIEFYKSEIVRLNLQIESIEGRPALYESKGFPFTEYDRLEQMQQLRESRSERLHCYTELHKLED